MEMLLCILEVVDVGFEVVLKVLESLCSISGGYEWCANMCYVWRSVFWRSWRASSVC